MGQEEEKSKKAESDSQKRRDKLQDADEAAGALTLGVAGKWDCAGEKAALW